jgi:hypothetical protein
VIITDVSVKVRVHPKYKNNQGGRRKRKNGCENEAGREG